MDKCSVTVKHSVRCSVSSMHSFLAMMWEVYWMCT